MHYRPRHFRLEELVDPDTFQARGERAWELLDTGALITLDQLRVRFGRCIVNDWHSGGELKLSGFRPANSPIGAKWSQHKHGRAFDCKFSDIKAEDVRRDIIEHEDDFPYLTVLERGVNWVHFDTRNHNRVGIWLVNP